MKVTEISTRLKPTAAPARRICAVGAMAWRHLRFLLMYSPRWLFFYPGLLLMTVGLLTGAWLLPSRGTCSESASTSTPCFIRRRRHPRFPGRCLRHFTKVFAITEGLCPKTLASTKRSSTSPLNPAFSAALPSSCWDSRAPSGRFTCGACNNSARSTPAHAPPLIPSVLS